MVREATISSPDRAGLPQNETAHAFLINERIGIAIAEKLVNERE
jgi:hypothetical protein